ncbi:helix-turn-helix domain-containing protein [Sphingobacterium spiritivorum]|uniref:Transcriptional regulator, AraC family n=1 Tax=Sphingobacterium spiritivorum ATCC 33861 TaxID=525373 RepID=D7VG85_SPHSI|nr:helix-turn-helix domain-containing protein [Sphingobacterium spiritivorum]EFK60060.1 transcriptional regulator, AraC family [Sphingobacterium spiritivorum ATCC 33861]QQT34779.1 AraC family transcriptional regulator [Sphingobacterium spiritivorum]WQD35667.1 helix-turn-helix domain-containing protein [Sphingobacterium spiritivorum]SUJ01253.1 transcriptional activator RhaS [Sphingobacterium spiritivorum]
MPINFLTAIRAQNKENYIQIPLENGSGSSIEGIYDFDGSMLCEQVALFSDGYPALILMPSCSDTVTVKSTTTQITLGSAWMCGGLIQRNFLQSAKPEGTIRIVRFHAPAFFRLFDLQPDCFASQSVYDLTNSSEPFFRSFINTYYQATDAKSRIKAVVNFISGQHIPSTKIPALLQERLEEIGKSSSPTIQHINYKWWQRAFKKHLGIAPQQYIQIQRFLKAYTLLEAFPSLSLNDVAYKIGYYDSNHLLKDFNKYIGQSPKAYFKTGLL